MSLFPREFFRMDFTTNPGIGDTFFRDKDAKEYTDGNRLYKSLMVHEAIITFLRSCEMAQNNGLTSLWSHFEQCTHGTHDRMTP